MLQSQVKDSISHQLPEVTIAERKTQQFQPSKKIIVIDSFVLNQYETTSIAELLSAQSAIHIKSYGNGNIATSTIRGGSASQTAVLWNGLNIQNPMLGQTDLSLLPVFLFENVTVEQGGGSALQGTGAIGGSILLHNKSLFDKGFNTKLQMSIGSFDTKKIGVSTQLSYKKVNSTTRIYYTSSENNYSYRDSIDKVQPIKKLEHANYLSKGLLQEFAIRPFKSHQINLRVWYNSMFRNLPSYTESKSTQSQLDENLKLNADWQFQKNKFQSVLRVGYFTDKLNYADSLAQIESNNTVRTFITENDNTYRFKNHWFNVGVIGTSYQSDAIAYQENKSLNKFAFFVAYKTFLLKQKIQYSFALRKEFTNLTVVPITGNTGVLYKLHKLLAVKVNAHKSFRQPTLNDLYWQPGGNPNLKPEEAYEVEGGVDFNFKKNNYSLSFQGTYFNKHTTNWILWRPINSSIWSPQNIAEVYSRGTETKTELVYQKKDVLFKSMLNTAYTLATNRKSNLENDNSIDRQLIYTPRYTGQLTAYLTYKKIGIMYSHSYTGYRFTTVDNTSWLNPYFIGNLKLSYSYLFHQTNFDAFFSVNNLFNSKYTVVSNRPMPLRNFELGLSIRFNKAKS